MCITYDKVGSAKITCDQVSRAHIIQSSYTETGDYASINQKDSTSMFLYELKDIPYKIPDCIREMQIQNIKSDFLFAIDKTSHNQTDLYFSTTGTSEMADITSNFINRTKEMHINILIVDVEEDYYSILSKCIVVNTDVYDSWSYSFCPGILKITLFEKENKRPDFKQI